MKKIWIIFKKEVVDNLRDRRSITSALVTPLFTPLFLLGLIVVMGQTMFADPAEKPVVLPVVGAEYAPGLMAFLEQENITVVPGPADPQAAVKSGEVEVVLIVPPDYAERFVEGEMVPVRMVMDSSRQSSIRSIQQTQSLVQQYSRLLGMLRLQARGIDPGILYPVSVTAVDLATPQSQAVIFLNMMPFFLLMVIFTGAMYVIIDTTAGERERGSLEPLLINPASRAQFALGKLLASLPFAIVTLILSLAAFWAMFNLFPIEDYVNIPMSLNFDAVWAIFLLLLPVLLLASALQMVVAAFTRSFKEAQTYLGFLPLIGGLPSAFLAFLPVRTTMVTSAIPTFGQSLLVNQLLRGEVVQLSNIWVASSGTLLLALLLSYLSVRLYQREQILFGR